MQFFSDAHIAGHPLEAYETGTLSIPDFDRLKQFLEFTHVRHGLLGVYGRNYPLIENRALLPSFEPQFTEYSHLPGFSMVVFNRAVDYQNETFQFNLVPYPDDPVFAGVKPHRSHRRAVIRPLDQGAELIRAHLPEPLRENFARWTWGRDVTSMARYSQIAPFLFKMDRAHVIAPDHEGTYRLRGVFASFPSNLDAELKDFGIKIGKFVKYDNLRYARNREFVYHFLMETYGFPIASERRTSAALFARDLCRQKESFLIAVLGNSDRTITTLYHPEPNKVFPLVQKWALVRAQNLDESAEKRLAEGGYFVDRERQVILVRVTYEQRRYHRRNVIEERALSVAGQEIVHPVSGCVVSDINFLQDKGSLVIELNDIVRGEHHGGIAYNDAETITGTRTHTARLKFIAAWIKKHERRLVDYADDTFAKIKSVLNSYILDVGLKAAFKKRRLLHREVLVNITRLQQARYLRELERIVTRKPASGNRPGVPETYEAAERFVHQNTDFLVSFYDDLFDKALSLIDLLLTDKYVVGRYLHGDPAHLTDYGRSVREANLRLAQARYEIVERFQRETTWAPRT